MPDHEVTEVNYHRREDIGLEHGDKTSAFDQAMTALERDPEPRECRLCGAVFITRLPNTGSKWTEQCDACLRYDI